MFLRLLVRTVSVGLLALVVGCATTQIRITPDTLSKIKKVGVVSLTAQDFYRQYTGLTVLGNDEEKRDISAWKVDDEYEVQMQSALSNLALFEPVRIPYQRADFNSVYDINGPWDAPAFRTPKWGAVEERLRSFASANSLDAVILVIRRESTDFLAGTNQYFRGADFYARGIGSMTSVSVLHLLATVAFIDGKTGKPIAMRILSRTYEGRPGSIVRGAPMIKVPRHYRAQNSKSLANKRLLKSGLCSLISQRMPGNQHLGRY